MSNYRDDVRDMMRDLKKPAKTDDADDDTNDKETAETGTEPVPNEEDLLDDILDLEEGAPVSDPIDEDEADKLLADSDDENEDKKKSKSANEKNSDDNKSNNGNKSDDSKSGDGESDDGKSDDGKSNDGKSDDKKPADKKSNVKKSDEKLTDEKPDEDMSEDGNESDDNEEPSAGGSPASINDKSESEQEKVEKKSNGEIGKDLDSDEKKDEESLDESETKMDTSENDTKENDTKENDNDDDEDDPLKDDEDENDKEEEEDSSSIKSVEEENNGETPSKSINKSRRDSDSSSIEMLEEFPSKKSYDEDEENDEASSSSATKIKRRGRPKGPGRPGRHSSTGGRPGRPKGKRNTPKKPKEQEIVNLSSNEDDQDQDSSDDEDEDEVGDPAKPPGEGCSKEVPEEYIQPFLYGWRREVVYRTAKKDAVAQCDIYYIPPQDGRYRTREAKRKRRSKADQERYFEDFPDETLSIKNFLYLRRPLGLENAAYEIVRKSKLRDKFEADEEKAEEKRKSMKEVEESAGLLESNSDSDDDELIMINGFDPEMPISLQAFQHTTGMQNEFKQRRKYRDPETCCTPPLVEDSLWSAMDDDPFGVYTNLGGRSSPVTPPPLRAVKLTYNETAEKIGKAFEEIKTEAFKHEPTKEVDLHEEQASHDYAIKKFKNYKSSLKLDPTWSPADKTFIFPHDRKGPGRPRGPRGLASSLIMRPTIDRPCTPKCAGSFGILPSMQCVICKAMFHAKCQGLISPNLKVFKCKRCLSKRLSQPLLPRAKANDSSTVKLKLPMVPKNGKRPIVELVLRTPEGRYQPIKFRNNSQITETIPRSLFHKANSAKKILYVKSTQLPKLNGKPVFLAINPMNPIGGGPRSASSQRSQPQARGGQPQMSDQVSILVKAQKNPNARPVLLNVPRKVAVKVKVGTTLSFSASNDQKYIVMDSKIHPPVGSKPPQPSRPSPKLPLPPGLSVMKTARPANKNPNVNRTLANLMNNKRPGLTITRGPSRGPSRPPKVAKARSTPLPSGANVLASGEVVTPTSVAAAQPCTPYCPGVTGFPDLECTHCQSLFHSKCVGIHQVVLEKIRKTFRCRICTPVLPRGRGRPPASSAVTVIDLD